MGNLTVTSDWVLILLNWTIGSGYIKLTGGLPIVRSLNPS